jgi:hypothetical protein
MCEVSKAKAKKEPPFDSADGIAQGIDCSDADQSGLSHSHGHQSGQTVVHIVKDYRQEWVNDQDASP